MIFNEYPLSSNFIPDDLLIKWDNATSSVKVVAQQDFLIALKDYWNYHDPVDEITTSETLADQKIVVCNSAVPIVLTLPEVADYEGYTYKIYNKGTGAVTIEPNGSETIDGDASLVLTQYKGKIITGLGSGLWASYWR